MISKYDNRKYCPICITLTMEVSKSTGLWTCLDCGWEENDTGHGGVREPRKPLPNGPKVTIKTPVPTKAQERIPVKV